MNFDPMTGEPIKRNFDPMTGEPINNQPEQMAEPVVEAPVAEPVAEAPVEPVAEAPVESAAESATGTTEAPTEVLTNNTAEWQQQMSFDPTTGQPVGMQPKKKKKTFAIIGAIVAAVLVIAVVAVVIINSGVFLSKADKVAKAVENTFAEKGALAEDLAISDIMESKKYTMSIGAEVEGVDINVDYRVNKSELQIAGEVGASGIFGIDFIAGIADDELKVQIPYVSDKVFTYNYVEEKNGYLPEMMGEEQIEAFDKMLQTMFNTEDKNGLNEKAYDALLEEYEKLEFEDASKETFEVDGKDRECKGYTTVITKENAENVIDAWEDIYADSYEEMEELMAVLDPYGSYNYSDTFEELRYMFEEMPDMEVTFYIYKNQLACIALEAEGEEIQIQFKGGDRRTQNICLVDVDGSVEMEIVGSTDGSVETTEIYADEECLFSIVYDSKSGEFEIYGGEDEFYMAGVIEADKKGFDIEIEEVRDMEETLDLSMTVSVRSGAEMEEISGDEFDFGNASEDEWMDLSEELNETLGTLY